LACQSGEVAGILQSPILSRRLRGTMTPVGEPRASRETKPHRGIQQDQGQEEFKREKAVETVGPQIPQRPPRQLRDGSRCSEKHSDSHHHCARSLWMVPDGIKVTSFAPASPQYSRTLPFDRENPTDAQRRYCTSHCSGQPRASRRSHRMHLPGIQSLGIPATDAEGASWPCRTPEPQARANHPPLGSTGLDL